MAKILTIRQLYGFSGSPSGKETMILSSRFRLPCMSLSSTLITSSTFLVSSAKGVDGSWVQLASVDCQSQPLLDLDVFHTWTNLVLIIQKAFQFLILRVCIQGDCSVMIEALKPVTIFGTTHVPQWRALTLLTTKFGIYNGDSRPEMWRRNSLEPWRRES